VNDEGCPARVPDTPRRSSSSDPGSGFARVTATLLTDTDAGLAAKRALVA